VSLETTIRKRGAAPFFVGVFLICMCSLMLQIVQTRVISVIVYYHLAFFAISMAMLGMTAGSLLVYFKPELFTRERLFEHLAWISSAFAISIVLSTLSLITTIIGSGVSNTVVMTLVVWFKLIAILVPPYVLAGMAIALALTRSPWRVGAVYGVDLVGAASGCLVTLVLLAWADAVSALIGIAAFASIASISFGLACRIAGEFPRSRFALSFLGRGRWPIALAFLFTATALLNAAAQPTTEASRWRNGLVLLMAKDTLELTRPSLVRWNSYSRVMATDSRVASPVLWGPSPTMPATTVSQRRLVIDGSAATTMYQFDGDISKLNFLRYDITNLVYTIRNQGRSAVIGVGGGRDLLSAYAFGFRDVIGIELNPIFVDLLTREFRDFNRLADLPGVRLIVDEARSWFARTDERFDVIQMSLIDTWAATGAGAYSLSENGLYTMQGWRNFLSALTPTGLFTVSRWFDPMDITETGRLISLAAAALRDQGITRPQAHLFVATTDRLATLIVSKSPFSIEEIAKLRWQTEQLKFDVQLSPDQADRLNVLAEVADAESADELAALSAREHLDLSITTDDRPFFFNQLNALDPVSVALARSRGDGILRGNLLATGTLMIIVVMSAVLVLYTMIIPALPSLRQVPMGLGLAGTLYFLLIGLGFMFVEIGLIQRISIFLGHPAYGLAIGLFGIIVSTGIGSLISERMPLNSNTRLITWSGVLGISLILLPLWVPTAVAAFESGPLFQRILVSLAIVVPPGLLMGFSFPTGMRLVNAIDARPTPWFWAVNGAAGVLAASVAVATSIAFSINASLWVGAVCYLLIAPVGITLASLSRTEMPHHDPAPALAG
jgi:predicted membrane-bound spermidine synthase